MATNIGFAEVLWGEVPDDLRTGMPNFFRGPNAEVGIYLGLLPIDRDGNEMPWQVFDNITPFVTPDLRTVTTTYRFWVWWNPEGFGVVSVEREGKPIADEVPFVLYMDALERFQDDLPDDEHLHLIPFSNSHEHITEYNLGDDVAIAMIQTLDFTYESSREDFLERVADAATN